MTRDIWNSLSDNYTDYLLEHTSPASISRVYTTAHFSKTLVHLNKTICYHIQEESGSYYTILTFEDVHSLLIAVPLSQLQGVNSHMV